MRPNPERPVPTRLTILLGALASFGPLSIDMYLPALPELTADLRTSTAAVALTLTACTIGLGLGQLIAGPLSDVLGRRRPLIIGVTLFALFSVACAIAPNIELLVLFRFFQALGGSAGIVISRAVARDLRSGPALARLFGMLMVVNGAAPILAPLLGGQLTRFTSWRGVFLVLAGLGLFLAAAAHALLVETLPPAHRQRGSVRTALHNYRILLADRAYVLVVLAGALAFATMFGYIAGSPFVLQEIYGLSPQRFSLVFGVNAAGIIVFGLSNRLLSPRRAVHLGLAMLVVGAVTVLAAAVSGGGLWPVLIGFFVITTGYGSIAPNVVAMAMEGHPEVAGAASAIMGAIQFVAGGLIAPLAGSGTVDAIPLGVVLTGASIATGVAGMLALRHAAGGAVHR